MTRKLKRAVFTVVAAVLSALTTAGVAQSVMTHHVREAGRTGEVAPNGRLSQNQVLQLDLVLPLRDPAGLKSFLSDVYNPKSPNYRHFVTPEEFTARFGPTQAQYDEVLNFARTNGLQVVGGSRDGMEVQVKGTVSAIEAALHVSLNTYPPPHGEPHVLRCRSRADAESVVQPVARLGARQLLASEAALCEEDRLRGGARDLSRTGSEPCHYRLGTVGIVPGQRHARRLRHRNDVDRRRASTWDCWSTYGTDLADLNTYYANVHQTNSVPITLLSTDGTSTSCVTPRCDDTEQTLDMTQALGMAPGWRAWTFTSARPQTWPSSAP